jgi:vacuolar-type H+-ATPase subunit H
MAATAETKQQPGVEHYPDKNASKIQSAISVLSDMESKLGDLSGQVSDMKRKLQSFAESESEKAKAEVLDQANREAQAALEELRKSTQKEADAIVAKGSSETEALRAKIAGKVSDAVDVIVNAVQSV